VYTISEMIPLNKKNLALLSQLRTNSRARLTEMSRTTGIPVSTIHDRLKAGFEGTVTKMTALLDFRSLGYTARATIILKVDKDHRGAVSGFLSASPPVNNLFKINNGYDFMVEGVFLTLVDLENFIEDLEDRFAIRDKQVYYIIDEIEREKFLP